MEHRLQEERKKCEAAKRYYCVHPEELVDGLPGAAHLLELQVCGSVHRSRDTHKLGLCSGICCLLTSQQSQTMDSLPSA